MIYCSTKETVCFVEPLLWLGPLFVYVKFLFKLFLFVMSSIVSFSIE